MLTAMDRREKALIQGELNRDLSNLWMRLH